jgi:hypothetical protein
LYERPFYQECLDKISDNFGGDYYGHFVGLILNLGWETQGGGGGGTVGYGKMTLLLRLLRRTMREREYCFDGGQRQLFVGDIKKIVLLDK